MKVFLLNAYGLEYKHIAYGHVEELTEDGELEINALAEDGHNRCCMAFCRISDVVLALAVFNIQFAKLHTKRGLSQIQRGLPHGMGTKARLEHAVHE